VSDTSEQIANLSLDKRRLLELLLLEETGGAHQEGRTAPSRRESASAPLSFSQQRLWFFDQAVRGSAVHNLSSVLRLKGRLNIGALEWSLNELIRRHEALRTVFPAIDGRPRQVFVTSSFQPLAVTDLSGLTEAERESEALRLAAREGQRPFDLARGPLLRVSVLRLGPEDHVLVFTTHHIISDGWSQGIIVREVSELYRACLTGTQAELPELPLQYADYALWERERLEGESLATRLAYWREALDQIAPLDLPTDRPRPAVPGFRSAGEAFELSTSLSEALRALSRREGVTLFMTLLASFKALLYYYSGQEDISVGSSVANRTRQEIENIVGCFVNILVLRTRLSGDPTVRELLGRVREVCLDGYAHADVPFERVVSELHPERILNRNPLFQVAFILLNAPTGEIDLPGLTLSRIEMDQGLAENDLSLILVEEQKRLTGRLTYNSDLIEQATVKRMLDHWQRVLEGFVADPDQHLSELQLLSEVERQQILYDWNETSTAYDRGRCVHEVFETQARLRASAVAVIHQEEQVTYRELNGRANQLAHYLQTLGVGPEVRVGICVERSAEMIVGLLGILKAGGVYVPLDPSYPLERLTFMVEDSMTPVILTQERLLDVLPATWASVICLDTEWDAIAQESDEDPQSRASEDNLCYVMYTSGSTGRPKGVSITHEGVVRLVRETNYVSLNPEDVFLQFAPISFDASTFEIWGSLLNGARLVVPPVQMRSPEELTDLIRRYEITTLWLTAALFHQMVEHDAASLASVRQLLAGGDVLQPRQVQKMIRQLSGHRLINGYGPTENTTFTCCYEMSAASRLEGAIPIGRPIANTQVYILDQQMRPVPVGVVGELYVGGRGLARDYLNRPDLTAEKFVPHPFSNRAGERLYRTGDSVRYLPDGNVEFLGRTDRQVKVRGFRIELEEIETALSQHPAVEQGVVVAREDQPGDKRLVAYLVHRPESKLTPDELRGYLKQRLPDYMLPSAFVSLAELPLSPNGKVDRRALPVPDSSRPQLAKTFVPPVSHAERLLAGVWAQVLGIDRVGLHDNFFDLGGDSMRSIEISALARKAGLGVSIQHLFQHQTIYELAQVAEQLENFQPADAATTPFSLVSEQDRMRMPPDVEDAYPLTRLQAGMLYHSEYTAETATYHDIFSYHLRAPFEPEALQEAVRELLSRHAVLRTSFDLTGYSQALQLVHKEVEVPFELEDLRHFSMAEQERVIRERIAAERLKRFDWERAPLLRFQVQRRSEQTFQLTLSFHHAILDGWSLATLLTEIFSRYLALLESITPDGALPPETAFRDYVALELAALESNEHRVYWAQKLADSTITRLPRPPRSRRAEATGPPVREISIPLSAERCQGLRHLAQAEGVPLKSVLLAAHLRVMSFLSAQPDLLTGIVSNGRPESSDGQRVLGLFLNTMPFRLKLRGGTWSNLIRETFETEREALSFRRYPLAEIQKIHSNGQPLIETCFNFTHYHVFQGLLESADIQLLDSRSVAETNFTLLTTFNVDEVSAAIQLSLDYNSAELCNEQVEEMARCYIATIDAMICDRQARYDLHCPLSAEERRRLLVEWNETAMPYPREQRLQDQFEAQATLRPMSVALIFNETRWTYGELNQRANQLAHYLRSLGVGPETLVGICMDRTPLMITGILATLKAGAAYLPLDPGYPQERLSFMLKDSRAAVLLTEQHLLENLPPHTARVICLDAGEAALERQSVENPSSGVTPENLAYVIYTSGSTGRPKGVAIEHRSAVAFLSWVKTVFSSQELDGVLFSTSICFDLSIFELFAPLSSGGKIILCENALQLSSLSCAGEVRLINLVPSALAELLRADGIPGSVRTVNLAGEPLSHDLVRETYAKKHIERVYNLYGPSEDTTYSTGILLDKESREPPPIGRPIANTQVYLLDQDMQPVAVGVPGNLYIGGCGLARGYLNESQLTAERFIPDPFAASPGSRLYQTGDLARYLPDGNLEFLGRVDHQVKIRGYRIELGEIEAVLKQHTMIEQAVVLALDNGSGERRLVAYIVMKDEGRATRFDLHAFLKSKLPGYMVPALFVPMESLPLTPNGKLNRAALPPPEPSNDEPPDTATLPRDTLELHLMQVWEEVLGIRRVGLRDHFFLDLGGHSILAVRLIAMIEKRLGHRLSLSTLLQGATVEQLALALRREGDAVEPSPLVAINPNGSRPPFFCVHPATGGALCYVHLARHLGGDQPFYGLQAPGLDGLEMPLRSIEELAGCYITALQKVQPDGPYFLGGHSFGGVVAFEMAQQLRRMGHEVALVAILDTLAPVTDSNSTPGLNGQTDARRLCEIVGVIERFLNRRIGIEDQEFELLSFEDQLALVLNRFKEIDLFPRDAGTTQVRGLLEVEKANVHALQQYVPQVYAGRITLFRAATLHDEDFTDSSSQRFSDPSAGWSALSSEPVDVHVVAGDHITMITETHVSVLAEKLRPYLDRVNGSRR
jgi:amino acid adenylation domain-containing protein